MFRSLWLSLLCRRALMPTGPSVMVLPGEGKSFDAFRADDAVCRQFAYEQVGGATGQQAAQDSAISSAVIGTAIGAAAGAAIGSASGDMGAGAAIGAGTGLLFGSAAGSGAASGSYYETQRRYDNAYMQCMYAKGNQIPLQADHPHYQAVFLSSASSRLSSATALKRRPNCGLHR
jgi:hypothetical protein